MTLISEETDIYLTEKVFSRILRCEMLFILLIIATVMIQCKLRGLNRLILARVGSPHYAADATDLSSDNIPQPSTIFLLLVVRAFFSSLSLGMCRGYLLSSLKCRTSSLSTFQHGCAFIRKL